MFTWIGYIFFGTIFLSNFKPYHDSKFFNEILLDNFMNRCGLITLSLNPIFQKYMFILWMLSNKNFIFMLSDHQKLWRDKHELSLSPYSQQKIVFFKLIFIFKNKRRKKWIVMRVLNKYHENSYKFCRANKKLFHVGKQFLSFPQIWKKNQ